MTTETMDKLYLEYSNLTTAKTAKELKLEAALRDIADGIKCSACSCSCHAYANKALSDISPKGEK